MTGALLQVVQFVHPGFEYHRSEHVGGRHVRSGVMSWKPGNSKHDRKFMLTRGSVLEWDAGRDRQSTEIVFWGEWEGPSVFWKLDEPPGMPMASIIHAPFRPASCPTEPIQNTDPMVFGDAFIYSNCLQHAYGSLRNLNAGSIVLFGRHSRADGQRSFSLDTCLVIDRVETLAPLRVSTDSYGSDLLTDAVLSPLHTEGAVGNLTVYFGRGRLGDRAEPFSFFPARAMNDSLPLFPRPRLAPTGPLQGVISPDNMQGINITSASSTSARNAIWEEVVRQVAQQGCGLGYRAARPPMLDWSAAEAATREPPTPLSA
jgi:hypothetical protein